MPTAGDETLLEDHQLRSEDRPEWGDQREKQREQTPEPGLGELFGKLIHDLRTNAGAEIGLLQTSYTLKWRALRIAVLALVVGGLLCLDRKSTRLNSSL